LSGFAANREQLLNRDLSRYRIVHFATHAVADLQAPQLSALILSMIDADGRQLAGEVFAGDLLSRGMDAELVVLSACDTALGRAAAGEGLLGMRYAAHASGARSVVASLWPVVDEVGARLMSGLYTAMVQGKTTPVAALSAAMRETRRRWPDPAMWAVFEVSRVDPARTIH
jgi:CHAT domain-containing protein